MEFLFVGGGMSFLSIAQDLRKLYRDLRRYVRALTVAASETKDLAREVSSFASLLLVVNDTLEGHQSTMRQSTEFQSVAKTQLDGGNDLVRQLKILIKDFSGLVNDGQGNFLQRFLMRHRWTEVKGDVNGLRIKVISLKGSLNILLAVVTVQALTKEIEVLKSQNPTSERIAVLEANVVHYKEQLRIEKKESQRIQREFVEYLKEQGRRPSLNSPIATAAQEAVDLAQDRITILNEAGFASSRSRSRRSRLSMTTPPEEIVVDHESQTRSRSSSPPSEAIVIDHESESQSRRLRRSNTPPEVIVIDYESETSGSDDTMGSVHNPQVDRPVEAHSSTNDSGRKNLRSTDIPISGTNAPDDRNRALGRIAENIDGRGGWIFSGSRTQSELGDNGTRSNGIRVKDEHGRIIWEDNPHNRPRSSSGR